MKKQQSDSDLGDFTTTAELIPADGASNGVADHSSAISTVSSSKAQAIRDAFASLGPKAKAKEVMNLLSERGVEVNSSQVSMVRVKHFGKKSRRRRRRPVAPAARTAQPVRSVPEGHIAIAHLKAADAYVRKVGSIKRARQAVELLGRLL